MHAASTRLKLFQYFLGRSGQTWEWSLRSRNFKISFISRMNRWIQVLFLKSALVKVWYEFGSWIFCDFLREVTKWKRWWSPIFEKKRLVWSGQVKSGGPKKSPRMTPKWSFLGFWQKSNPFMYTFYLSMKVLMLFWLFARPTWLGNIWFLSYDQKVGLFAESGLVG